MERDYTDYPELSRLYLEDSYVLEIIEDSARLAFDLEAVLLQGHPAYHDPIEGEQYCYARGLLTFDDISDVEWVSRSHATYTDASGEEDLGNIDSLTNEDGVFQVEGDWGQVHFRSSQAPTFELYSDSTNRVGQPLPGTE